MTLRIQNHDYAFPAGGADPQTGKLHFPTHPGLSKRDLFAMHLMPYYLGLGEEPVLAAQRAVLAANDLLIMCDRITNDGDLR